MRTSTGDAIIYVFLFSMGMWFGITITEIRLAQEPQIVYREVLPSPVVYFEGKRSEPGEKLAPETLRVLELEEIEEGTSCRRLLVDELPGGAK